MTETDELRRLLSEPPEDALERERTAQERLRSRSASPLVLRGAGRLGQSILASLLSERIPVAALTDGNPARWHSHVQGVPILPPAEAAARYGQHAQFVVTIYSPGRSVGAVLRELEAMGCRNRMSFLPILWGLGDKGLPHFSLDQPHRLLAQRDRILDAFALLSDDLSRELFVRQIRMRLTGECGEFDHLVSTSDQYLPANLLQLQPGERLLDGGAFDGDTLRTVLALGSFDRIVCVEPDPENFRRLRRQVSELPVETRQKISLVEAALGAHSGFTQFAATGETGASVSQSGADTVRCVTLPEAMEGIVPSYIKLDIEGGEEAALTGGEALIREHTPTLAVCVYHRPNDLWELPLLVKRFNPGYGLYLRCHAYDGLDSVAYALPEARWSHKSQPLRKRM